MFIFNEHSGNTVRTLLMSVFNCINHITFGIYDMECQGNAAIQAVSCTGHSGVIGPNGHLHLVQDSLVVFAVFNERGYSLFHTHIHWTDIVGGSNDEICVFDTTILISDIIMNQGSPRSLNNPHTSSSFRFDFRPDVGIGNAFPIE